MFRLDPVTQPRLVFLSLIILAVIGPLSIDLFTPSLPAISMAFDATHDLSQWTVSIFMLGFALSMLIVGPVSERFGHHRTLIGGYCVYLIATVVILFTSSLEVFIAARFAQAVFGCFGTALSRALARDLYKGENDVKVLGMIGATLCVAPMIAPIVGGMLQETWDWQASFVLMLVLGTVAITAVNLLPGERKGNPDAGLGEMFEGFGVLFKDRQFLVPALTASLAFAGAFVFVAAAPFVLIDAFEISPKHYGMIFAAIMGTYIGSSLLAGRITDHLGRAKATWLAWIVLVLGATIAFGSAMMTQGQSVFGLVTGMIVFEAGLGLFLPACQSKALAHLDRHSGTASGLIFFLEMIIASGVSYLAGRMILDNTLPLSGIMVLMTMLALAIAAVGQGKPQTTTVSV